MLISCPLFLDRSPQYQEGSPPNLNFGKLGKFVTVTDIAELLCKNRGLLTDPIRKGNPGMNMTRIVKDVSKYTIKETADIYLTRLVPVSQSGRQPRKTTTIAPRVLSITFFAKTVDINKIFVRFSVELRVCIRFQ